MSQDVFLSMEINFTLDLTDVNFPPREESASLSDQQERQRKLQGYTTQREASGNQADRGANKVAKHLIQLFFCYI